MRASSDARSASSPLLRSSFRLRLKAAEARFFLRLRSPGDVGLRERFLGDGMLS